LPNYVLVKRGNRVESRHCIHAAVFNKQNELIAKVGNPHFSTYFRSSAKPFQTLALFRSGVIDHFDFSEKEIALITSSHNGEDFHVEGVRKILERIRAKETNLKCGFHPPYFPIAAENFYQQKLEKSPIFNNCSGKHAGMLAACVYQNYDLTTYLRPDHPHQKLVRSIVAEFSETPFDDLNIAIDGCGVPVFYLSLAQMANMNVKYIMNQEIAIQRIINAIIKHPDYLAGTDRFDTEFIRVLQGRAITKVGAEAIQSFMFFEPEPVGVVIKNEDGQFRGVESASIEILLQLKLITETEAENLRKFWQPKLKNHVGTLVGEIIPNIKVESLSNSSKIGDWHAVSSRAI